MFLQRFLNLDAEFCEAWQGLKATDRDAFAGRGMTDALVWHGLAGDTEPEDLREALAEKLERLKLLDPGDAHAASYKNRLSAAVTLAVASVGAAGTWADNMANVSDLQLNVDRALARKRLSEEKVENELKRLKSTMAQQLPAVWRGKRYHRAEQAGDPKGQQRAEDKARLRWGKRVVEILVEARLPFGLEVQQRNLTPGANETTRCLRGLRWTTLKKRVSDWEPARRWSHGARLEGGIGRAGGGGRILLMYDIKKAHRRIPVLQSEWGRQACQMKGSAVASAMARRSCAKRPVEATGDGDAKPVPIRKEDFTAEELAEKVFLNCVGTFGVTSAGYWWGRAAGAIVRLTQYVLGHEDALLGAHILRRRPGDVGV